MCGRLSLDIYFIVRIDQEMQCTMLDYYMPQDLEIKIKLEIEGQELYFIFKVLGSVKI